MARTKKTPEQKAEKQAQDAVASAKASLDFQLQEIRSKLINEPTIIRKVGDNVQYGNIEKSIVTEVLDDGKIYLLHQKYLHNNYGKHVPMERQMYVPWQEVQDFKTPEEQEQTPQLSYRDGVRMSQFNATLDGIVHRYYNKTNMSPEYQRGDVWEASDKVALIDSIFNNVEIGKFAFITLPYSRDGFQYEILNGKQRLQSIIDFVEGRFEYKGKKFRELHRLDQHHLRNYSVLMTETENLTLEQKCKYFLKLNTTGKPQSQEHMDKIRKMIK